MTLAITCWGVRGSIPTPGAGTVRFGGNTPCLTVSDESGHRLIIDAGTGIRQLGRALDSGERHLPELTILLSHTHWDHIQGLPFFLPLHRAGNHVTVLGPKQPGPSLESVLGSQMAPAVFPVPLTALAAELAVTEITAPEFAVSGFRVRAIPLCHPGATLGFSISDSHGGPSFSYMTDNELGASSGGADRRPFVRFLRGIDTLVHDAMYFESEKATRVGWGHSSAADAVALALEAGVRRLVLFHHDPSHDDDALGRLLAEAEAARARQNGELTIMVGTEGTTFHC